VFRRPLSPRQKETAASACPERSTQRQSSNQVQAKSQDNSHHSISNSATSSSAHMNSSKSTSHWTTATPSPSNSTTIPSTTVYSNKGRSTSQPTIQKSSKPLARSQHGSQNLRWSQRPKVNGSAGESRQRSPLPLKKPEQLKQVQSHRSCSQPMPATSQVLPPSVGSAPVTPRSESSWARRAPLSPRSTAGGSSSSRSWAVINSDSIPGSASEAAARSTHSQLRAWMARARKEANALYTSGALTGLKVLPRSDGDCSEPSSPLSKDHTVGDVQSPQTQIVGRSIPPEELSSLQIAQQQIEELHQQYMEVQQLLGAKEYDPLPGSPRSLSPTATWRGHAAVTPLKLDGLAARATPAASSPLDSARDADASRGSSCSPPVSARRASPRGTDAGSASSLRPTPPGSWVAGPPWRRPGPGGWP